MIGTDAPSFTAAEREFLHFEFSQRFGQGPLLVDGIFLRTWRTGPAIGKA